METDKEGLYVVGDGYGITQGIIASVIEITNFKGRKKIKEATKINLISLTSITLL